MTRIPFFVCVASLFTPSAVSFVAINNESQSSLLRSSTTISSPTSSVLQYANSDVAEDPTTNKLDSFRNSIISSLKRIDVEQKEEEPNNNTVLSASDLLTQQLVREFTTGRRYLLAAGAVKGMSQYFYAQEEQQRVKAMELIEYARSKGIQLASDYSDMITKTPIDKKLPTNEFVQELLKQDQQDMQFLDMAVMQVSKMSSLPSSDHADLVNFFESIKLGYVDRQHEFLGLLTQTVPSLDIPTSMGGIVLDQATAAAATAVDAATATTSTLAAAEAQTSAESIVSSATSGPGWTLPRSIPKSEDLVGEVGSISQLPSSIPKSEDLVGEVGSISQLPDPHMVAAATAAPVVVAAVDSTDGLPSTEDILDALPTIDTDEIVEMVTDALPSTTDILDALPISISPDDIQQAVDSFDTIQQNLMDAETLAQFVDIVTGLY